MTSNITTPVAAALLITGLGGAAGAADLPDDLFATVGETVISVDEFRTAVHAGARGKFFHGAVPEEAMARFEREVGERIEEVLLEREAKRRGIEPDPDWVAPRLDAFVRRAASHPDWEAQRERLVPELESKLRAESRIRNLRARVEEQAGTPPEHVVRAYYDANPQKFTEPERIRVAAILLKVDPSAPVSVWTAAEDEAREIVERLRAGADFGETARLRSGDASAERGGDMGYLHRGMLGTIAQAAIDATATGEVADPVRLLEGVAIFRVDDRPVPRLRHFEEVAERAAELWLRERREVLWTEFRRALRDEAEVQVNEQHYLPLPG